MWNPFKKPIEPVNKPFIDISHADKIKTKHGLTPLMKAVIHKNYSYVQELIDTNIDLDTTDDRGMTAVMHAIAMKDKTSAKLLIKARASLDRTSTFSPNTLHLAVQQNDLELVQLILAQVKELPYDLKQKILNAKDDNGKTPLYYAGYFGNVDIINALAEAKAVFNDAAGQEALKIAILNNHVAAAIAMINRDNGANPDLHFNLREEIMSGSSINTASGSDIDHTKLVKQNDTLLMFAIRLTAALNGQAKEKAKSPATTIPVAIVAASSSVASATIAVAAAAPEAKETAHIEESQALTEAEIAHSKEKGKEKEVEAPPSTSTGSTPKKNLGEQLVAVILKRHPRAIYANSKINNREVTSEELVVRLVNQAYAQDINMTHTHLVGQNLNVHADIATSKRLAFALAPGQTTTENARRLFQDPTYIITPEQQQRKDRVEAKYADKYQHATHAPELKLQRKHKFS